MPGTSWRQRRCHPALRQLNQLKAYNATASSWWRCCRDSAHLPLPRPQRLLLASFMIGFAIYRHPSILVSVYLWLGARTW